MSIVFGIALATLTLAGALTMVRVLRGPTPADRVVALETLLLILTGAVSIRIAQVGDPRLGGVLVVIALLAFIGTAAVARFLERSRDDQIASSPRPAAAATRGRRRRQ